MDSTNLILLLLGSVLVLCFVLMLMQKKPSLENFDATIPNPNSDPVINAIQSQLSGQTPDQLKKTIQNLQQRLIDYGYAPDLNKYVTKSELGRDGGKCTVSVADDRDKFIPKTDVPPPGPRIDLSQYVKKSAIPPAPVCPPVPTVDLSAYVKKSTLPPNEKCPPCIAPKVKVSAGLCRECPPAPPCPAPEPCPACNCPPPAPCPTQKECKKCDEIRYIKVPAVITKTIMVDQNGNIISQQLDSGSTNPTAVASTMPATTIPATTIPFATNMPDSNADIYVTNNYYQNEDGTYTSQPPSVSGGSGDSKTIWSQLTSILNSSKNNINNMPTTTFPAMASNVPNTNLAQTLDNTPDIAIASSRGNYCPSSDLNTPFKEYNQGVTGRNESNFPYR
jgi:hypothetical protein